MLTLILGISLGLLLLFVIVLLVTEVVATYPVWKHFDRQVLSSSEELPGNVKSLPYRRLSKLVFAALGVLCFVVVVAALSLQPGVPEPGVKGTKATRVLLPKTLSANSADSSIYFQLQTKWEDGRLYGNCTAAFRTGTVRPLTDCRLYLLDRDGFLVKAVSFGPADFVLEVSANSSVRRMVSRFNTELSSDDYLKMEKLQVAVDGKVPQAP